MSGMDVLQILAFLVGGLGIGAVYLWLLKAGTEALVSGRGWLRASVFAVTRLAIIAAALWLAVQYGALPMLALFVGFLVARQLWIARIREA